MAGRIFALVDGNNFYVSCERLWRPSLVGRPVIVLSNNDGCAIARSNEAKALGIRMGTPFFEVRHLQEEAGLVALSSNYTLYGDMSDRMMSVAAGLGPRQEIYSIDECFVELTGVRGDLTARGRAVRERILQWVGIPCGIGIGPTKTLAKLANHIAKGAERRLGSYPAELAQVADLASLPQPELEALLAATPLQEIWGIGPRIGAQLREAGLSTALDVRRLDPAAVRQRWSVVLERTVRELQGVPCIAMDDEPPAKKEIACTRSFGAPVRDLQSLQEAITGFAARAAHKLRSQESLCGQVLVFIRTSPFRASDRQYSRSLVVPLRAPTADTGQICRAALLGLERIYQPGFNYAKGGVMLLELQPQSIEQAELDLGDAPADRGELMSAVDKLEERFGRGTVGYASGGSRRAPRPWTVKSERRTPRYTTHWDEMAVARA